MELQEFGNHQVISEYIYNNKVSMKDKIKIDQQSKMLGSILDSCSIIRFTSETNSDVNNGNDFLLNKNRQLACQQYRVLFFAQIIRYLSNVLNKITDKLHATKNQEIPFLNEYFMIYRCDDSYLLKKRNFIK